MKPHEPGICPQCAEVLRAIAAKLRAAKLPSAREHDKDMRQADADTIAAALEAVAEERLGDR